MAATTSDPCARSHAVTGQPGGRRAFAAPRSASGHTSKRRRLSLVTTASYVPDFPRFFTPARCVRSQACCKQRGASGAPGPCPRPRAGRSLGEAAPPTCPPRSTEPIHVGAPAGVPAPTKSLCTPFSSCLPTDTHTSPSPPPIHLPVPRDWIASSIPRMEGFNADDLARVLLPDLAGVDASVLTISAALAICLVYW